jgi:hypothetical protein
LIIRIDGLFDLVAPEAINISDVELAMYASGLIPTVFTPGNFEIFSDACNLSGGVGLNAATGLSVWSTLEVLEASSGR